MIQMLMHIPRLGFAIFFRSADFLPYIRECIRVLLEFLNFVFFSHLRDCFIDFWQQSLWVTLGDRDADIRGRAKFVEAQSCQIIVGCLILLRDGTVYKDRVNLAVGNFFDQVKNALQGNRVDIRNLTDDLQLRRCCLRADGLTFKIAVGLVLIRVFLFYQELRREPLSDTDSRNQQLLFSRQWLRCQPVRCRTVPCSARSADC